MSEELLRVDGVSKAFGGIPVLQNVSLALDRGEILALVGANGAGKSTTLRTVSGLVRPASGKIIFEGIDITRASAGKILSLGIAHCPEGRRVFPHMSVEENLEMGSYLRSDSAVIRSDLQRMFEQFPRLAERRRQVAGTLSGGEQQMLAIARALMSRPKLMMFDEPSLGLAPNIVEQMFELIRSVNKAGTTILMVEQNANAALSMSDYAYLLETGAMTLEGPGKEMLSNPHIRHAYLGH